MLGVAVFFFGALATHAEELNSGSYKVLEPVMYSGGYSTSGTFQLLGSIGEIAVGTSSSLTYGGKAAFLTYPFVTTPSLSATAGDTQVSLSWTASSGFLGWTVSGYSVGRSTTSGGPYTYTSVGNVLSSTETGLTNGTPYYFVVRVKDALGNFIATSTESTATPTGSGGGSSSTSSSGSSSGGGSIFPGVVTFSGLAYPGATIQVLTDGVVSNTALTAADGSFTISTGGLASGGYMFVLIAKDSDGNYSSLYSIPLQVAGQTTVTGILLSPTISLDPQVVKRGDSVTVSGFAEPGSITYVVLGNEARLLGQIAVPATGRYELKLDSSLYEEGLYSITTRATLQGKTVPTSRQVFLQVGKETVHKPPTVCAAGKGDLNCDGRVNLVDFSIMIYWVDRPNPPVSVDLSHDGKITLEDFSILVYYWTG